MSEEYAPFEVKSWGKYKIVWMESSRLQECLDFYYKNKLDGIGISPHQGYKLDSLDFLRYCPDLQGIVLVYASRFNLSPVEKLTSLRFMTVADNDWPMDYSQFPNLEDIRIDWNIKIKLPTTSRTLKHLYLHHFKPRSKSCVELPDAPNLQTLELVQSTIESLDGISRYRLLDYLSIAYCYKLTDVKEIGELKLNDLEFQNCKKAEISPHLEKIKSLKKLKIFACKPLPSVSFLNNMPNIEFLSFVDTAIENGDLSPCLKLKYVGFTNKKHYSYKCNELQRIIEKRESKQNK